MKNTRAFTGFLLATLCACGEADDSIGAVPGPVPLHPILHCESFDPAPCDIRIGECQLRLFELAACLRGDEAGEPPPISIVTEQEYAQHLRERWTENPPPDPNHYERALTLLGLLQPGAFDVEAAIAAQVEWVLGTFRHETQDILIVDHGDDLSLERGSVILVHEFIHALQDRALGLVQFQEQHATSFDSALAIDSLIEGEARLHETRYLASAFGLNPAELDWQRHFQTGVERAETEILAATSPYQATWGEFPYQWGSRYMHFIWQAGGATAIQQRFAAPPTTAVTLMASVDAALEQEFTPNVVPAPVPSTEWTLADDTTLGAWGTFMTLALLSSATSARPMALAWRGDGLWAYFDSAGATAVVWRIEFADDATAATARSYLASRFSDQVEQQGARVVLAASSDPTALLEWAFAP